MAVRNPNHRLVKIHRTYTVEETSSLFGIHRQTVRAWLKQGLPAIDTRRPALILGNELVAFLKRRRTKNRRPCGAGEIYCVRCRLPRRPAGDMAQYKERTATLGDLVGTCPECRCLMYRRVNVARLEEVRGKLAVSVAKGRRHIDETSGPSVNPNFRGEATTDGDAQPC